MPRFLAVVLFLTVASSVNAATTFDVEIDGNSRLRGVQKATVTIDGSKIRIDLEPLPDAVLAHDSVISSDAPGSFIGLNSNNKTWYNLEGDSPLAPTSHLLSWGLPADTKLKGVKVAFTREEAGEAGIASRYVGRISYDTVGSFQGNAIRISHGVTALITTNPELAHIAWPGTMLFRTGIPAVDERIREDSSAIIGFPLAIELSFVRTYHGGSPTTEHIMMKVRDIRDAPVSPDLFETPPGYREQKPIVGIPGQ